MLDNPQISLWNDCRCRMIKENDLENGLGHLSNNPSRTQKIVAIKKPINT